MQSYVGTIYSNRSLVVDLVVTLLLRRQFDSRRNKNKLLGNIYKS